MIASPFCLSLHRDCPYKAYPCVEKSMFNQSYCHDHPKITLAFMDAVQHLLSWGLCICRLSATSMIWLNQWRQCSLAQASMMLWATPDPGSTTTCICPMLTCCTCCCICDNSFWFCIWLWLWLFWYQAFLSATGKCGLLYQSWLEVHLQTMVMTQDSQ